ncbi:MAG: YdeI/OmpD-associated family protein, partial [Sphingomicrobium sp.]
DWEKRPPGYRKVVLHWVTSAKKPETRARRLATLIECSARGEKIPGYDIGKKK